LDQAATTIASDKEALKDPGVREKLYAALAEAEAEEFTDPSKTGESAAAV
jgi:hypothetical protein